MANNVIGQFADEVEQTAGEVANDVKDEFGQALEQGVQSVIGAQLTPQSFDSASDKQQKQQETQKQEFDRQKQLSYTRKWIQDLKISQEKARAENKQKEQQRLQVQEQEKQVEVKKEEKKKQAINPAIVYAGKAEFKRGVVG